jgi:hypothetical protein
MSDAPNSSREVVSLPGAAPNGGDLAFSFPAGIQDDSYQELADVFE